MNNREELKKEFAKLSNYDLNILKQRTQEDLCYTSGVYQERSLALIRRINDELKRRAEERMKANELKQNGQN